MTQQTSGDLAAWTEKVIGRREEAAQAATDGPWTETGIGDFGWTVSAPAGAIVETEDSEQGRVNAVHIALHGPDVVLRRCARDRKLLELHGGNMHNCPATDETGYLDEWTHFGYDDACPVVQSLAEAYGWTGEEPNT